MADRIEVYIKTESVTTSQSIAGHAVHDGVTTHYCTFKETAKTEKAMSETDEFALQVARDFANQNRLELVIYDVSTLTGKLSARIKGVRTTPAIILGSARVEGEQISQLSTAMLESGLKK